MKIALVQFYQYHEEILAPQIDFLLPEHELFLAAPQIIFKNDYIIAFESSVKKIIFSNKKYSRNIAAVPFRILSIIVKYFHLFVAVRRHNIDIIIYNTINRQFHFFLIRLLFRTKKSVHIIHNAQMFTTHRTAKSLSFFGKNLFLSLNVYDYFTTKHAQTMDKVIFDWFLPSLNSLVFHEDISHHDILSRDKINIVIPGSVDDSRRNYNGLFVSLGSLALLPQNQPFKILLLGKASSEKQKLIHDMGLDHIIETFDKYIPGKLMLSLIKNSDAIAFLMDDTTNCKIYNTYKATGTSVFCLSFGLPCIVSDDFILDTGLKDRAIVYPDSHIEFVFNDIINGKLTKEHFAKLKKIPSQDEYSYEFQRLHYREIINSINS